MKLSDLKNGMVIKNREGNKRIYIDNKLFCSEFTMQISNVKKKYTENLKCKDNELIDIMEVYENCKLIWKREEIELTGEEKEILKALKVLGLTYLAKDENGSLCAYDNKVYKFSTYWIGFDNVVKLNKRLFVFIKWEDEEPYSIEELLNL